ncbi:MAG: hypothetical protein BGO93_11580 [Mesorhizobium sp. 65-26]|nr:MAG: hypothetical protein ABS57_03305 [Mesorhizobium sp. SCN 65-12]OJX78994.1 MAG: hypothetical protein BGO93_11580 [Mesorhizobium sp. 65-26]
MERLPVPPFKAVEAKVTVVSRRLALPLIALPGISPRKRGERGWPQPRRVFATFKLGEMYCDSVLLPVYGEKMAAAR